MQVAEHFWSANECEEPSDRMTPSSVAAACSSKIEAWQNFCAERGPGAIDAAAERRMQHELHAARLIEEALETSVSVVGKAPSERLPSAR